MVRSLTTIALLTTLASTDAFTASVPSSRASMRLAVSTTPTDLPFYAEMTERESFAPIQNEMQPSQQPSQSTVATLGKPKPAPKKAAAAAAKKGGAHSQGGIFSPIVKAAKQVLGEEKLNQVRGRAIGLHSDVISKFVDTAETAYGERVLQQLFKLADRDGSGTICREELKTAVQVLGFDWLQDKQVDGIFKRADADGSGAIDLEEWMKEAPKTLRTNLIKLAKKNGGELGFLA
jgi:hypothetical protein